MRRAPVVIGATIVGLAGVLAFHTRPAQLSLPSVSGAGATGKPVPGASPSARPQRASATGKPVRGTSPSATPRGSSGASPRPGKTARPAGDAARSATGPRINYSYGVLSVKVRVSGSKIRNVGIASLDDEGNPQSESIDQRAIPILEQEVLQAHSANIQGVSGASFTSAGFVQSLQGALHTLGFS